MWSLRNAGVVIMSSTRSPRTCSPSKLLTVGKIWYVLAALVSVSAGTLPATPPSGASVKPTGLTSASNALTGPGKVVRAVRSALIVGASAAVCARTTACGIVVVKYASSR